MAISEHKFDTFGLHFHITNVKVEKAIAAIHTLRLAIEWLNLVSLAFNYTQLNCFCLKDILKQIIFLIVFFN